MCTLTCWVRHTDKVSKDANKHPQRRLALISVNCKKHSSGDRTQCVSKYQVLYVQKSGDDDSAEPATQVTKEEDRVQGGGFLLGKSQVTLHRV